MLEGTRCASGKKRCCRIIANVRGVTGTTLLDHNRLFKDKRSGGTSQGGKAYSDVKLKKKKKVRNCEQVDDKMGKTVLAIAASTPRMGS